MRMIHRLTLLPFLLLLLPLASQAAHRSDAFSFGVNANFLAFSTQYKLDNPLFLGLNAGYDFTPRVSGRFHYGPFTSEQRRDQKRNVRGDLYSLNIDYHYRPQQRLQPFSTAGLALIYLNPNYDDANKSFAANVGGGLEYFWEPNASTSLELRDLYTFAGGRNSLLARFAVNFYFGGHC